MENMLAEIFENNAVYVNQTVLHPLGLTAILVLGTTMLIVPRKYSVVPMVIMACFIAPAQRIVIATLNFDLLRVMILFGWVRVLAREEARGFAWKRLDSVFLAWILVRLVAFTLLYGSFDALKFQLGEAFDALGMYFLFRCLIRSWDDVYQTVMAFAIVSVPVAIAFAMESSTGRNLFAVLGGVPEITMIREGRLRCQGAFAHPILAGCFWAAVMPLFAAIALVHKSSRVWMLTGLICGWLIIAFCASSTPIMAVIFSAGCAFMFPLRHWLRAFRWATLLTIVGLHMVMKAPVWHLISRMDVVGGSTGWHRYWLIDEAVQHFSEWWMFGTAGCSKWGDGLVDVTNQYIEQGIRGGMLTMILFIVMIAYAFGGVGQMITAASSANNRSALILSWALGTALFAHCMNFLAVSYFGQIIMVWYLLLGIIGSLTPVPHPAGRVQVVRPRTPRRRPAVTRKFNPPVQGVVGADTIGLTLGTHPTK